jgi:hypothetical protein
MSFTSQAIKVPVIAIALTVVLSACGQQGNWESRYAAGLKAEKAGDLKTASEDYKAAMTDAWQHHVNDKLYFDVIKQEANLLVSQHKEVEAIPYMVRELQLGSAKGMGLEENIKLLHTIARAEAKAEDWQEAAGTEHTLITLLEVEKSPFTPELVEERKFNTEVNAKLQAMLKRASATDVADLQTKDQSHISASPNHKTE